MLKAKQPSSSEQILITKLTTKLQKTFKQLTQLSHQTLNFIKQSKQKPSKSKKISIQQKNDNENQDLNDNLLSQINHISTGSILKKNNKLEQQAEEDFQDEQEIIQDQHIEDKGSSRIKNHIKNKKKLSDSNKIFRKVQTKIQTKVKQRQITKQKQHKKSIKIVSHKPKAPTSSFLLFFKQQQHSISKSYPNYGVVELTKVAAKCWNQLSIQQKQPYQKSFQLQRKKYQQQMQIYKKQFPEEVKQNELEKKEKKKIKQLQKKQKISASENNILNNNINNNNINTTSINKSNKSTKNVQNINQTKNIQNINKANTIKSKSNNNHNNGNMKVNNKSINKQVEISNKQLNSYNKSISNIKQNKQQIFSVLAIDNNHKNTNTNNNTIIQNPRIISSSKPSSQPNCFPQNIAINQNYSTATPYPRQPELFKPSTIMQQQSQSNTNVIKNNYGNNIHNNNNINKSIKIQHNPIDQYDQLGSLNGDNQCGNQNLEEQENSLGENI